MKNIYSFYVAILLPLGLLVSLLRLELISSTYFVILLLSYSFLYRPFIDGSRLVEKNIISKKDRWKLINPACRSQHFKELYILK
ncbi:hypothetical protein L1I30_02755 [Gillisia sp. M10.2A]|uniref:Uncharacterized protein n=1 Tax=Gillisia lutea TaxID=2909668 RepID=A0ABS9EGM0_9FLAO|nr:hypothetical protein [Gillisia lutea]MCF4100578.1 hypothetical protein [Gillisia lutea]